MDLKTDLDNISDSGSAGGGDEELELSVAPANGRRRNSFTWDGLGSQSSDDDANGSRGKRAAGPQTVSWDLTNAIRHIDATTQPRSFKSTTLADKIALVRKNTEKHSVKPAAATKSRKPSREDDDLEMDNTDSDAEDEVEDVLDDDSDGEAGGKAKPKRRAADTDESESASGSDDDADDGGSDSADDQEEEAQASDDDEDGNDDGADSGGEGGQVEVEEDTASADAGSADGSSEDDDSEGEDDDVEEHAGDEIAELTATAKPNPHRQSGPRSAATEAPETFSKFFVADPFETGAAAVATDTVRAMQLPGAGSAAASGAKRSRKQMETGSSSNGGGGAAAEGVVDGEAPMLPTGIREPSTFAEMNLSRPLLRAVAALSFTAPTPIQRRVVPLALAGHDVCGSAVTGSGKTAAYLLPVLERLLYVQRGRHAAAATRVIILTPTRELATQVQAMAVALAQFCTSAGSPSIRTCLVVGGLSLSAQEAELRTRPDIVIATPGRLLDHLRNSRAFGAEGVDVLVLDEADRLLEMGFEAEVTEVVKACPPGRQTLLFSATMTPRVDALAAISLRKAIRVSADPLFDMANRLVQEFVRIRAAREGDREAILMALLSRSFSGGGVLVFSAQKRTAHRLAILCGMAGLKAGELHGNLTQRQRLEALEAFRRGEVDYLIATDLAGRGLDIPGVRAVINFEMPRDLTSYVHRVGRTARAGRAGVACTLVLEGQQRTMMKEIVRRAALNVRSRVVPPSVVAAWRAKLDAWEPQVLAVLEEEAVEREARMADREATTAENLIKHREEIMARPARTWFMTPAEKREAAVAAKAAAEVKLPPTAPGAAAAAAARPASKQEAAAAALKKTEARPHRMTRKKRRRLEALAAEDKEARRITKLEADAAKQNKAAAGAGVGGAKLKKVAKGAGSGSGGGGAGAGASGQAVSDDEAPAPLLDKETAKAKKRLEATMMASTQQHAIARRAKHAARDEANKLGVTPNALAKLRAKEAKHKKKAKQGRGSHAPAGPGAASSSHDASGGGSAFASEARDASALAVHAFKKHGTGFMKHQQHGRKSFKSQKRFKRR